VWTSVGLRLLRDTTIPRGRGILRQAATPNIREPGTTTDTSHADEA
jgi:hypothetical protein